MTKETKSKAKNPLLEEETTIVETESEEVVTDETPVAKVAKSTPKAVVTDVTKELRSDIENTKRILASEAQVQIMIPLAQGEKAGATHDCYINGYKVTVKKGAMVSVPDSISKLIAQHYEIEMTAGSEFLVDADSSKTEALN